MAHILVIDDEPDFCRILEIFLEDKGHQVHSATNAEEIATYLADSQPDLVLMDVRMPDVNGLELLPQLKADLPTCNVIVITALNDYRIADLLYESGADGFLTKPVRLEDLDHAVHRLLNAHTTSAS